MTVRDDTVTARDNYERFRRVYDGGHESFIKTALRCEEFYRGEQWREEDRKKLDEEGRPALTLNTILSTVNSIIGEQLERKLDLNFRPGPGGDDETAFALNTVTRCILAANRFEDIEEEAFADGIITGRGYYDVRLDFSENILGDVRISTEDMMDVIPDPEARSANPADWNEVFISRWMTPDEIAVEYGDDKRDTIVGIAETASWNDPESFDLQSRRYGGEDYDGDLETDPSVARSVRRVRVIERQFYELTKGLFFVDMETGDLRPVPMAMTKADAELNAERMGVGVIERKTRRVRIRTSVDDVMLYDDWSPYRSFTIVPFFPYFRRGNPFGVVENLLDPQELLNKTSSQELHIVNTTANSGWVVEEGSLVNMDEEELEERGAETGLVLVYRRGAKSKPDKIQPNQIPTGIDRISQKAANTIREVSAVNASMLGAARADQSGKAQYAAINRGQVQVSVILNNLLRSRRWLVEKILELVQDFYTEPRYFEMQGENKSLFGGRMDDPQPVTQVAINEPSEQGGFLNDVTLGKYTVEVTHAPAGGSQHDIEMAEVLRLREMGVQIPDHVVVELSNLRRREELAAFLKQAQGFGDPTPEQQQLAEFQQQHAMKKMQAELEELASEIEVKKADAAQARAKALSMEGYNQADMELMRLQLQYQQKHDDLAARIALSARSHENMQSLNDTRVASQLRMKQMEQATALAKQTPQTQE